MRSEDCYHIHFIDDHYDFTLDISLKNDERQRRAIRNYSPSYVIYEGMKIPSWNNFLGNPENKAGLLNFISNEWCAHADWIPEGLSLIIGGTFQVSGKAVCIINKTETVLSDLSCADHEEADTRIFAHLGYCVQQFQCELAVIFSIDTDVVILSMLYYNHFDIIKEMWIEKNNQFLPIHKMVNELCSSSRATQTELIKTVVCGYVISGNDHLSYPFRHGKKRAAKTAISLAGNINAFANFGDTGYSIEPDVKNDARLFFISLYGRGREFESLDSLREHIFASSKSDLRTLPPTEDAFHFHFLRVLYELLMYKRAHLCNLSLPSANNFDRQVING